MLPKSLRVNLSKEFKTIAASSRAESANFKYYFQRTDSTFARIGIALSKNYFKKAVQRNKAKRKTSAAAEKIYDGLPKGLNLIIMPKTKVLDLEASALAEEITHVKRIFD